MSMRPKEPGEGWATAYVLRPLVHVAFWFGPEARMVRRYQRRQRRG